MSKTVPFNHLMASYKDARNRFDRASPIERVAIGKEMAILSAHIKEWEAHASKYSRCTSTYAGDATSGDNSPNISF